MPNMKTPTSRLALVLVIGWQSCCCADQAFQPGKPWYDLDGNLIQAHGGGIIFHQNKFYWHGENRDPNSPAAVSCYSSTNLYHWHLESHPILKQQIEERFGARTFVERPKVAYNPRTKKFVFWMHLDRPGYNFARAGVGISDSPTGPVTILHAIRPITNDFNFPSNDPNQQKSFGGTFRDMTLYVDSDTNAYVFYASENNATMYVVRLNDEWTGPAQPALEGKTWARILVGQMREAPVVFKHQNIYYLITSGCTGWRPNAASLAISTNILGPWQVVGNPCVGPLADTTFNSQGTFALPIPNKPGKFIFLADRWNPSNLAISTYVWLPLTVTSPGTCKIEWQDSWTWENF